MTHGIKFGLTALAVTGLAGTANAASLNELIPNTFGTEVVLTDENRENLIDRNQNNVIDVGDSLFGILVFDQLFHTEPGQPTSPQFSLNHNAGNSELTGVFQVLVTDKTETAPGSGVFNFTFGVDSAFDTDNNGTIIRLYEDAPGGTSFAGNLDSGNTSAFTDGNFYFSAGIVSAGNAFVGTGGDTLTGLQPSERLGDSVFALDLTAVGTADFPGLATLSNVAGSGQFIGDSNIGGPLAGSDWDLSSHTTAQFQVVPTPAAAGAGLIMLGALAARRRRQA